jgi:radical SAM protein with 4Fe4S-binding SPASM domain
MKLEEARRRLPIYGKIKAADNRMSRSLPVGVYEPRLVVWELTLACDQKCHHCGSRAGARRSSELDLETCLALVTELRDLGAGEVVLIGGEAYLRNDFILIARAIRAAGMRCTMTTGALNLTQARVEALAEAGIRVVNVSIDGLEDAHDRLRGVEGSWRSAFEALGRLRDAGVVTTCNTQINAWTKSQLPELLEHIAAVGASMWQLQVTAAFGNAADRPDILLEPYELLEVFEDIDRVLDRAAQLGVRVWPANSLGYFGPSETRLRQDQNTAAHYKGCHAGQTSMGIEADGRIKGCPSLGGPENWAGMYRPGNLRELWEHGEALAYTRVRGESHLWGYCAECYYKSTCRGGCTAVAEPLMGRPGNNPFCHHRALEMDRMGLRERVELVREAEGLPFDHGYYRIVREAKDESRRGPETIVIEEPRVSRAVEAAGPGRELA